MCDWCWIIIVSEGVYKVYGVWNFVFLFAESIVNSFNFISNENSQTEFKFWLRLFVLTLH